MKIAFLSNTDYSLYLFRQPIIKELVSRGHKVYAVCPAGAKNEALRELGAEVVNYELSRKGLNPFSEYKTIDAIYQAINELHLDVIHTFAVKPNAYGTLAAKRAKVPVILNLVEGLGSFYIHNDLKSRVIRKIMEVLYKKAFSISDGCVFVNSDDPAYMVQKGLIAQEKVKIIKSVGVDVDKFDINNFGQERIDEVKKSLHVEGKTIVLMVARAIWDKGVREYYEAAKLIKKSNPHVEFLFAGDTDDGNPSCADESYLDGGQVGWLRHRDDIAELMAVCDVFVLPSYREGLPVTLMESSSMSKPIVTTDTVGCKDVVDDGVNGFLVPVKDAHALTNKIGILINDKSLRETFGKNGRQKVMREFDSKIVTKQYMVYYQKMIKGF